MKIPKVSLFLLYIIFGAYLINLALEFYPLPDVLFYLNKYFISAGGALLIIGAFHFLKRKPKKE